MFGSGGETALKYWKPLESLESLDTRSCLKTSRSNAGEPTFCTATLHDFDCCTEKKLIFSRLALLQTSINQAWKRQLSTIPSHFPAFAAGSKTGPNWPFNTCTFDHSKSSESSNIHSNQTECSWPGYHSKLSSS